MGICCDSCKKVVDMVGDCFYKLAFSPDGDWKCDYDFENYILCLYCARGKLDLEFPNKKVIKDE